MEAGDVIFAAGDPCGDVEVPGSAEVFIAGVRYFNSLKVKGRFVFSSDSLAGVDSLSKAVLGDPGTTDKDGMRKGGLIAFLKAELVPLTPAKQGQRLSGAVSGRAYEVKSSSIRDARVILWTPPDLPGLSVNADEIRSITDNIELIRQLSFTYASPELRVVMLEAAIRLMVTLVNICDRSKR